MPNAAARKIIEDAMNDPAVYEEMARKENEVWSNMTREGRWTAILEGDRKASKELGVNRRSIGLPMMLAKHGLSPESGLSIGCGEGRAERGLFAQGVCKSWHGIDIAQSSIERAREVAAEEGLPMTYEVQDANSLSLPADTYDLVVAQTSIHHLVQLEHIADEIARSLRGDGLLWLHDYVGESQFQFTDMRMKLFNDLLAILPEKFRFSPMHRRTIDSMSRPVPGNLVSPFESIRSGEIKDVFQERFEVLEKYEGQAFLPRVVMPGMHAHYLENEDTRALFKVLEYFDQLLVDEGIVPPALGQYLMRVKR